MTIDELKGLRAAVTSSKKNTDDALNALFDDYDDEIYDWGFNDTEEVSFQLSKNTDDLQWVKNFIENINPKLAWHRIYGIYDRVDDNDIKDDVVNFIDDLIKNTQEEK